MKRNYEDLDLRTAFRQEPERCHQALMNAACSIKEEKQTMRKNPVRTLLIAAVVVLSMLTTAFAAGEIFGWNDYFARQGIHTTPQMQNAMQMDAKTYTLGPVTFTVQEAVSDNRFALVSTRIAPTDGSPALMTMFEDDYVSAGGDRSRVLMKALGIEEGSRPCYEAAAEKNIPMYTVRAVIEVDEEYNGGEGMEDILWDAQGNVAYFSQHTLNSANVPEQLPIRLFLRVAQVNEQGEVIDKWTAREEMTITVGKLLAEKDYTPDRPYVRDGAQLTGVHAELYVTGAYLTFSWQMPEGMAYNEDAFSIWDYHTDDMQLTDGIFNEFERGVSLSGSYAVPAWPTVTVEEMINVDALPEVIRISDDAQDVTYK